MNVKIIVFDVDGTISPFNKGCEDFNNTLEYYEQLKQRDSLVKLIKFLKAKKGVKFFILTRCTLKNNLLLNDSYYLPIIKVIGAKNIFGAVSLKDINPSGYDPEYNKFGRKDKIKINRILWAYKKTKFMETLVKQYKVSRESVFLVDDDGMNTLIAYNNGYSVAYSSHRHVGIDFGLCVMKNIVDNNGLTSRFFKYSFIKEMNRVLKDKSIEKPEYIRIQRNLKNMREKVIAKPFIRNILKVLREELRFFSIVPNQTIMTKIRLNNYESLKLT